jgi:NitT/TauT family transport system ATP-binding protein
MKKTTRLPHVSLARLFSLIEVMDQTDGPDDVFRLGQTLMLGLDELLPLLEAARLLGWVTVIAGDYDLTEDGRTVARAEVSQRKRLVRSRVRTVPLIASILGALEKGREIPREAVVAPLRPAFGKAEAERQVDTAVDWGRGAELFDYDADGGVFFR